MMSSGRGDTRSDQQELGNEGQDINSLDSGNPHTRSVNMAQGMALPLNHASLPSVKGRFFEKTAIVELGEATPEDDGATNKGPKLNGRVGNLPRTDESPVASQADSEHPDTYQRSSRTSVPESVYSPSPLKDSFDANSCSRSSAAEVKASTEKELPTDRSREGRVGQGGPKGMPAKRNSVVLRKRRSWMSSNSSQQKPDVVQSDDKVQRSGARNRSSQFLERRKSWALSSRESENSPVEKRVDGTTASKKGAVLTKTSKHRLSGIFGSSQNGEPNAAATLPENIPPVPVVPKSFSDDRLSFSSRSHTSSIRGPSLPRSISGDRLQMLRFEHGRRKDELLSVLKTLESEYQRFVSKPLASKAAIIRTSLHAFLLTYRFHPSNYKLRPEDLDRRVNILNKWWVGLLELLSGSNNISIGGSDRSAILDGIIGIMERPEWRLSPSPFCPLTDRTASSSLPRSTSTSSLASGGSDFVTESVHHNVRNTFVQNLTSQMVFVLNKMSLRNAPAGLVTFCGKTCAYAFFFCPGIADILVRLWKPSPDIIKRILEDSGVSKRADLRDPAKDIISSFPPCLQSLAFSTVTRAIRDLRAPTPYPLGTANAPWHGSWIERWSGRESDLLYVFAKAYHVLLVDFLPAEASKVERLCAPGYIFLQAQLLMNLDSTIHKQASQQPAEPAGGPSSITFDDFLAEPNASASPLSLLTTNANRLMAENRLIMLTRDFLSRKGSSHPAAQDNFAEAFNILLQAAARGTSQFDQNACIAFCDLLEEAIAILTRYERIRWAEKPVIDWSFWINVCKLMVANNWIWTELRVYSFLHTIWHTLTSNNARKRELCLNFLLEQDFFESRFRHWSPMVRAFYMRLLCWRVGRYDGDDPADSLEILQVFASRLLRVWSHFLFEWEEAAMKGSMFPSTTPCNPAPGRRLAIRRTKDEMGGHNGSLLTFDRILQTAENVRPTDYDTHSALIHMSDNDFRSGGALSPDSDSSDWDQEGQDGKRRWSIFRNILGATRKPKARTSDASSDRTPITMSSPARSDTDVSNGQASRPYHRKYSFRFELEMTERQTPAQASRRLPPPRLPAPAHALLHQTRFDGTSMMVPIKPVGSSAMSSKYGGRALAEWAMLVNECQNFFDRRKYEGVPSNEFVETPMLEIDAVRKLSSGSSSA